MPGQRTALFSRKQSGGMFTIHDVIEHPGDIWFVGSAVTGATDGAGYGRNPDAPFAALDYAIQQATANQGDVIYLLPNHAETINTAGAIELDKAGISVIGLGNGENRPVITIGSSLDTSTVLVSAVDCLIRNVVMQPGNDGVDVLLDVNADDLTVEDCVLRSDEANAYQADTYIDINGGANGADRCTIRRCTISSITAGAIQGIEIGAVEAGLIIEQCVIDGDYSVAGIHSGSILTNALIKDNVISNVNAGDFAIELTAAATGQMVGNRFYADAAATTLDPGSMMCVGNFMVNAIDQSSIPVPTTAGGVLPTGAIGAASFAAGAIDAAAIAAAAIDAATFAADALQAMQDEAQDAIQGENLDHLAAVTTVAADMTAEVVDGSIISRILSKTSDTSTYVPTTDSLETISDKAGAFSGDGGAAQDDSAKASLDLVHTMLGAADGVTTDSLNGKLGTDTELADRSLYDILNGGGPAATAAAAVPANDVSLYAALRAVYNLVVPTIATGETDLDEGNFAWDSAYPALLTILPTAGAPLSDVVVYLDLAKATEGFAAHYAAQTIQFHIERKIDGTNWRRDAGVLAAALSGTLAASRLVKIDIGDVGVTEDVRVTAILSAELDGVENSEIPYVVSYKALAAPTITPLVETP